jgi:hypothetical protein
MKQCYLIIVLAVVAGSLFAGTAKDAGTAKVNELGWISIAITDDNDDAEECKAEIVGESEVLGEMDMSSSDLELQFDHTPQYVGLLFRNVQLAKDDTVEGAYIQFQVDAISAGKTDAAIDLIIYGALEASVDSIRDVPFDISSHAVRTDSVSWSPPPSVAVGDRGEAERTPDISAIIEQIVAQEGWVAGNNILLVVTGDVAQVEDKNREVEAGPGADAPTLYYARDFDRAETTVWDPPTVSDGLWTSDMNWSDGLAPDSNIAVFSVYGAPECVLDGSAYTSYFVIGDGDSGEAVVRVVDGGVLTTSAHSAAVGQTSEGTLIVETGGVVNFDSMLVAWEAGSKGTVTLNGGTVNVASMVSLGDSAVIDIGAGTLIIAGDHLDEVNTYIAAGNITAYGGAGMLHKTYDVLEDETVITAIENPAIITIPITASHDDAEEYAAGKGGEIIGGMDLTSSDLEIVYDSEVQYVGMLFRNVLIEPNATIYDASVQFTVDAIKADVTNADITVDIYGAKVPTVDAITEDLFSISSHPHTTATVAWSPDTSGAVGDAGAAERTPD